MIDDFTFSSRRRKLLAGLGTAATSGLTASLVGRTRTARAQESKRGTVMPSILAFDVHESTLDINHLQPLFKAAVRATARW